jgi:hypothetical protein
MLHIGEVWQSFAEQEERKGASAQQHSRSSPRTTTRWNRPPQAPPSVSWWSIGELLDTACWMWNGPSFVAQKSQVEILIVVTETISRTANCPAAREVALPRITLIPLNLGPASAGLFLHERLTAAATCSPGIERDLTDDEWIGIMHHVTRSLDEVQR